MTPDRRVVVIGAGIGGLTTAALLARAGLDVTVLEAHIYPGGCAGTFYYQGYRFDAGATLAAGFEPGGGMTRLGEVLDIIWPVERAEIAMAVRLPDASVITRWTDADRWQQERLEKFGPAAETFWRWQEKTADALWGLALRAAPWPPQGVREFARLGDSGIRASAGAPSILPTLALDAFRPIAVHLRDAPERLRRYVDGQLLISAQATSDAANALYGAAALDMPRRGVAHVRGGIGAIATLLMQAVRRHGGRVHLRQRVISVTPGADSYMVTTEKGLAAPADHVVFNLPPWDAAALLGDATPPALHEARLPADGWGAFMAYVGIEDGAATAAAPLHQQVLIGEPPGEGNSLFLSLSLADDRGRAPIGHRALTISTHTQLKPWGDLFRSDRAAYEDRKAAYLDRLLASAERALPGLRTSLKLALPGTPASFQRFTHRSQGWVGGFPQTRLDRAWAPNLGHGLWLVGDSIFPGQSVLATALGGRRVAAAVAASATRRAGCAKYTAGRNSNTRALISAKIGAPGELSE